MFVVANMDDLSEVEVEYITLPGWQASIKDFRKFDELPTNAQLYVKKIQEILNIPSKLWRYQSSDFTIQIYVLAFWHW